jgi:hypothetical protein
VVAGYCEEVSPYVAKLYIGELMNTNGMWTNIHVRKAIWVSILAVRTPFLRRVKLNAEGAVAVSNTLDLEGSVDAVLACLPVPRAWVFSSFLLLAWWPPLLYFIVKKIFYLAGMKYIHTFMPYLYC